jgi:integrase
MTVQVLSSHLLAKRKARKLSENGLADLTWKLSVAVQFLGDYDAATLDTHTIDEEFVGKALAERLAIEDAAIAGAPLMERVKDKRGRTYQRRRRGLSRGSINKVLAAINALMKEAIRRKLRTDNPVEPDLYLKAEKGSRSFLHPRHMKALCDGAKAIEVENEGLTGAKARYIRASDKSAVALAREMRISDVTIGKVRRGLIWTDEAGPRRRNDIARHALVATLLMAGLRVSECCALRGADVDLAAGVIRVRLDTTKTEAGEREVPMVPALREILIAHRADRPYGPADFVFPTRDGTGKPSNVRSTIIDAAHERANEMLEASGETLIGHCTPHSLRRTVASILAELGLPMRRAMYLLGHTNPRFTIAVYEQVMDMSDGGLETIEKLLGGRADDLFTVLSGRAARRPFSRVTAEYDKKMPSWSATDDDQEG